MREAHKKREQEAGRLRLERLPGRICACGEGILVGPNSYDVGGASRLYNFESRHGVENVTRVTKDEYEQRFGVPSEHSEPSPKETE